MKITDYGLWFRDDDDAEIWLKNIVPRRKLSIYLHGIWFGTQSRIDFPFVVFIYSLKAAGFKLKSDVPGELDEFSRWVFPLNYLPTESDFEDL